MNGSEKITHNEANLFGLVRDLSATPYVELHFCDGIEWTRSDSVSWPKMVFLTRPFYSDDLVTVKEMVSKISTSAAPDKWVVSPLSNPMFIEDVLNENGMIHSMTWPAMQLYPTDFKIVNRTPERLTIEAVTGKKSILMWAKTVYHKVPETEETKNLALMFHHAALTHPNRFKFFLITLDRHSVSAAMLYFKKNTAGIYWMATLPKFRKRGIGTHIAIHMIQTAFNSGADKCVLHATKMGYPIYLELGFREVFKYKVYCLQ